MSNLELYDVVILAFPSWWGQAPRIVETFVEAHDFSGKTVLPFCTSGGSGFGSTGEKLAALTGGGRYLAGGSAFFRRYRGGGAGGLVPGNGHSTVSKINT